MNWRRRIEKLEMILGAEDCGPRAIRNAALHHLETGEWPSGKAGDLAREMDLCSLAMEGSVPLVE